MKKLQTLFIYILIVWSIVPFLFSDAKVQQKTFAAKNFQPTPRFLQRISPWVMYDTIIGLKVTYISSLLMVGAITMTTVVIQSWRAATENPVNNIKTEWHLRAESVCIWTDFAWNASISSVPSSIPLILAATTYIAASRPDSQARVSKNHTLYCLIFRQSASARAENLGGFGLLTYFCSNKS